MGVYAPTHTFFTQHSCNSMMIKTNRLPGTGSLKITIDGRAYLRFRSTTAATRTLSGRIIATIDIIMAKAGTTSKMSKNSVIKMFSIFICIILG